MSHKARTSRLRLFPGYAVRRDGEGLMTFTRLHEKGHLTPPAAIASILQIASLHRHLPEHHAIYIDKVRKLRTRGTWL